MSFVVVKEIGMVKAVAFLAIDALYHRVLLEIFPLLRTFPTYVTIHKPPKMAVCAL